MAKALTIGLLTSGGDAPGMNAAIRAVVLAADKNNCLVYGFYHGYNGLINAEYKALSPVDVDNIIHQGGTILKSARCPEMLTEEGIKQAANTLHKAKVDALVVIGGDGSFNGLIALKPYWQGQMIGLPGTIDNDLDGTDYTIGFSSAVNTAANAIDNIRDTANAFDRVFVVEVMGRHSGHIAFHVGLACGAEQIISFENFSPKQSEQKLEELYQDISYLKQNREQSYLILLAENLWPDGPQMLAEQLKQQYNIDTATCILGHIQRGGSPDVKDRLLATQMGISAIDTLLAGISEVMIGEVGGKIATVSLNEAIKHHKSARQDYISGYQLLKANLNRD